MSARLINALSVAFALLFSFSLVSAQQSPLAASHVPQLVSSGKASPMTAMDAASHLQLVISLPVRNEAALDALIQQIYDPQSPNFHHYLSSQEFTDLFAPTQADYDAVVQWAQSNGLQVTATTPNRHIINVDGSVADIARSFNVGMNMYQDNATGRQFHAPDREPTADSPVALFAVSGLDNALPPRPHYSQRSSAIQSSGTSQAANPVALISGSGPGNTYLPSDMRKAYYGSGSLTGAGQTVAIFSFDGYIANDIGVYYTSTGTTQTVPVHNVLVAGYNGACFGFNSDGTINTSTCDDGEPILDIVNVIGMAPGLTQVLFYEGTSAQSVLNQMATDNTAKVISSSWGGGDFGTASTPIFKQFQAQGQSYLNASGDSGQFNSSTWFPPSTDAEITQVGGTNLTTTGAGGPWASETGWADSGGGFISGTAIPSYQQQAGVINSSNQGSTTLRNAPDVAAEANFDNTTVINGQFQSGYGGTSFAAPRWAGLIALANQQSVANGHGTLGFLNPLLYTIGLGSSYATDFHDITSGKNPPRLGTGSGFNAVVGYDLVTGWGSPNGPALITTLAGTVATPDYSLAASPSSLSVVQGASGNSTITVTDLAGFTGSVALTASGLPSGVTASFSPSSTTATSTLTLTVSSTAATGTVNVTVIGTSGSLTHTATVSLTVTAPATPNYTLLALPSSLSIAQGANGSTAIALSPTGGFTGSVALSASGLPTGVTASFSPASTTGSSTLTFTVPSTAFTGSTNVTITGTSGTLTHSTTVALTITATATPNYTLSASPSSLSVAQGAGGNSTVTVTPSGGFTGSVSLSASGLPAGVTAAFSPSSTTSASTLTLTAATTATTGTAIVTVTGTSGALTHTTTVTLTVTAAGGTVTQIIGNPGFETGVTTPWGMALNVLCNATKCPGQVAHTGNWFAWMDGTGVSHTDTVQQKVTITSGKTTATLNFFLHIDTAETTTTRANDTLTLYLTDSAGGILAVLATYSNLNATPGYVQHTFDLSHYIGQGVQLKFVGTENGSLQTSFVLDDVTLNVQ